MLKLFLLFLFLSILSFANSITLGVNDLGWVAEMGKTKFLKQTRHLKDFKLVFLIAQFSSVFFFI